ncbi:MAG: tetratricopeptide repeat protein [Acidobacteriota bacterium]
MKNPVFFLLLTALAAIPVCGQSGGAGTGGGVGTGSGSTSGAGAAGAPTGGSRTGQPVISMPGTSSTQGLSTVQRPIFISGKVTMDDGSPIPPNVAIQRVCNGNPRSVAYADSRGHFSFQWGQQSSFMSDASEAGGGGLGGLGSGSTGGFGSAQSAGGGNPLASDPFGHQMANCELRAQLGGYRSDSINLINRNPMDNPDVGMIVLHRLANVEGTSISATSFMAPKDAKKAYEKGLQSMLKNKNEDASKEFEKAVLAYPKYADAWMSLGKIRLQQKALEPAREAMLKAIEADPKLVGPYIDLGIMAAQQQKWEEAGQYLDRGLKLDPIDFPQAWYVDSVANYNLKKYDAADKSAREALKQDPRHGNPRIQYLLGLILVEKHDYPGSAEQFRDYLKNAPNAADREKVKDQLAELEKVMDQAKEASKH